MFKLISKKVPNGKLLCIKINYNELIKEVVLTGDFFLHPENGIILIEDCLKEIPINSSKAFIEKKINKVIKENDLKLIGFSASDLAELIKEGLNCGE